MNVELPSQLLNLFITGRYIFFCEYHISDEQVEKLTREFNIHYRACIGSLIYLFYTIVELCFSVNKLAKFHIFPVLLIKDMINDVGDTTTPYKLATGTKPSVSHLSVLFYPCVVRKTTANVDKKALNMRHQAQKG